MRDLWRLRRSGLFDPAWYTARHPEAATDPAGHFLRHGGDPGPGFSATAYLTANPDVAAAGINPLRHYLLDGWAQGRPIQSGPHEPPHLAASAVLTLAECLHALLRHVRPRYRALHAEPGVDAGSTRPIRPAGGAMPRGWCLMSTQGQPADLLVLTGGRTLFVEVPQAPKQALVRLPDVPARLAVRRRDRPGPNAAPRPVVMVREMGAWHARALTRRHGGVVRPGEITSYADWVRLYDTPTASQTAAMADRAGRLISGPVFSVVPNRATSPQERHALAAGLEAQLYPRWHCLAPGTADFVVFVDPDAMLAPHALLLLAEAIAADPAVDLLYCDEDQVVDGIRQDPWFKPDFSPERQRQQNLFGALEVVRASLLSVRSTLTPAFVSSGAQARGEDTADATGLAEGRRVQHLPHILVHTRRPPAPARPAPEPAIGPWPSVTATIPTRDHADVLRTCLHGLLHTTDYPALDILVADNGTTESSARAVLADARRRGAVVLPCPGPFNYSAINNHAAKAAAGELLLFLNNDVSMLEPGWLKQMVVLARRPGIGAVGAKLLYPDGTLQHGGVVVGPGGVAGHVHPGAAGDDPGYAGRLRLTQEVSAVTAACMIVPARAFAAVGGFDADNLPVAFNDTDLCLRLRRAGFRILWTPHAVLHHWESKSRGSDLSPARLAGFTAEIAIMQERWSDELANDPFFSPNLSLEATGPAWAFPPRVPRPWHKRAIP